MTPRHSILLAAVFVTAAVNSVAQSTYVVDNQKGPGTYSADIATALAVAVDGDTIAVRTSPIDYETPGGVLRITQQISIVGVDVGLPTPRPFISDRIVIEPGAGRRVILAGLNQGGDGPGLHDIQVRGGSAVMVDVTTHQIDAQEFEELTIHGMTSSIEVSTPKPRLIATNAATTAPGRIHIQGSRLVPPFNWRADMPAIRCSNVELEIADCLIRGYVGFPIIGLPNGAGIEGSGRLVLLGDAIIWPGGPSSTAVRWTGSFDLAVNTEINGAIEGAQTASVPAQPIVRHPPLVDLGQSFPLDAEAQPSSVLPVFLSCDWGRQSLAGVTTPLLIDGQEALLLRTLQIEATGTASAPIVVPNILALRYSTWFLQGAELDVHGTLRLTARGAFTVR